MRHGLVLADGAFDRLHPGHVRYLEFASQRGKPLLVRVAPDSVIRAKGREPQLTQAERIELLEALWMVDEVIAGDGDDLPAVIRQHHPAVLVKGAEWDGRLPEEVLQACDAVDTTIIFYAPSLMERHTTERIG